MARGGGARQPGTGNSGDRTKPAARTNSGAAPLFHQRREEEEELWVDLVAKRRKSRGSSVNIKFPVVLGLK
jgi:hypothetical protein